MLNVARKICLVEGLTSAFISQHVIISYLYPGLYLLRLIFLNPALNIFGIRLNRSKTGLLLTFCLFQVFKCFKDRRNEAAIQEWIALSFNNFVNRSPPDLGIWSISCLFCLASSNHWNFSLYPFLRLRPKKLDDFLLEIFLQSGLDFFHSIEVADTRSGFLDALRAASKTSFPVKLLLAKISESE